MNNNIQQRMQYKQELTAHLDKYRQDIESQGLSVLELRILAQELIGLCDDGDSTQQERDLASAEFNVVNSMVTANAAPIPTPMEVSMELDRTGDSVGAESLRHSIGLEAAAAALRDAGVSLRTAQGEGIHSTRYIADLEANVTALQDAYNEMPKITPAHQRKMEADALTREGNAKRTSAALLEDSQDDGVQKQAVALQAESDQAFQDALNLRSFVPTPMVDASTTESGEPGGDAMSSFERGQMIQAGQRRGAAA